MRIFEAKREKIREKWKKLNNKELHSKNISSNFAREMNSRRMGWVAQVDCMRKRKMHTNFDKEPERKRQL